MHMDCCEAVPGADHGHDTFIGESMCDCIEHCVLMHVKQLLSCTIAV
jgi:hypothetical protein